jgi:creatinine amidohydrolase
MSRPFILAESTWDTVRETRFEVAVLPWGATEAHNRHLPYATDTIQTEAIVGAAVELAWTRGAKVVALPAIPFGVQTGQLDIPLCLNLNPSTQLAILRDLIESLEPHSIRKLVIVNGHGGNDFRQAIRELAPAANLLLCQANWYTMVDPRPFFDDLGDHAGELETSVMLHLAPGLVRPLGVAGPGRARKWKVKALRDGWAWSPRQWTKVSDDTGVGDPRAATADKGARFSAAVVDRLAELLVDLDAADPHDLFE